MVGVGATAWAWAAENKPDPPVTKAALADDKTARRVIGLRVILCPSLGSMRVQFQLLSKPHPSTFGFNLHHEKYRFYRRNPHTIVKEGHSSSYKKDYPYSDIFHIHFVPKQLREIVMARLAAKHFDPKQPPLSRCCAE
jgi:hypothetical protein